MPHHRLYILIDSREASVTCARQFYQEMGKPELDTVDHFRPKDFVKALQQLLASAKTADTILIATHFLPEDQLEQIQGYINDSEVQADRITIASYDCFTYIKKWCHENGIGFKAITYRKRKLSSKAETNISHYLEKKKDRLGKSDQLALERIWVQYRLILSIISRLEELGEVVRELITHPGCDRNTMLKELTRVGRYHKLGEPDMAGGSYSSERTPPNLIDQLRERINYIAATDYNVLIQGESGSGKETTAWAIHELSSRCDKPFMAVNCAGFTDELLESEMFGYVKGAHSQALTDYTGIMEQVDGGTLFLDELPDMGQRVQAKLMRCLETGEFRPVGSKHNKYSDVRIIAAGQNDRINDTTKLRADLKSRIGQLGITVHSLRDNEIQFPGTIHKLAYVLLERYTWETVFRDNKPYVLTPFDIKRYQEHLNDKAIMTKLSKAQWIESNIRELNNFLRHWLVFGDKELARLRTSEKPGESVSGRLSGTLQGEPLFDYVNLPSSRKELQGFFQEHQFNDIKRAYIKYVFKVFSQIVEDEKVETGLNVKPTQKSLAGLIGITENTLSRYRN